MPRIKIVAEDTNDELVFQCGTTLKPQDLTGWDSATVRIRDLVTDVAENAATSAIRTPPTLGQVAFTLSPAQRVHGRVYVAECIAVHPVGGPFTFPQPGYAALEIEVERRRPTPPPAP